MSCPVTPVRTALLKKTGEEREPCALLETHWCSRCVNRTEAPQKMKNRTTVRSSSSTLGTHPKDMKTGSEKSIFTALLSVATSYSSQGTETA